MSARPLASLFEPASVAVLGASDDTRKWGNWLARGALRGESRRSVYLVNRRGGDVLGRRAYRSLAELPDSPELVVVAVPVAGLEQSIEEALGVGARAIVAISAGDNDSVAAARLYGALATRVRDAGAVLLGPNCLGVLDSGAALELVPNPLPAGSIGLISQSGNLALELGLLAEHEGLGFSRFVSVGNQADVDATELVNELCSHQSTELIALYVEDFRDGRAFARAASAARACGKPVVMLAIERGEATSRAVRSHTGALATDDVVIDAACRAAGINRVHTPQQLIDLSMALLRAPAPRGRRVAVLADGGGHGSVASAAAARAGLAVPALDETVVSALRADLPVSAAVANPVDLAGGGEQDVHTFDRTARVLLESGQVDAVLLTGYFGGYAEYGDELAREELSAAKLLGEAATASGRPLVAHTMYPDAPAARALSAAGVPVYPSIERAVGAVAGLVAHAVCEPSGVPSPPPPADVVDGVDGVEGDDQPAARRLLASAGIRFVDHADAMAPLTDGLKLRIGARWDARFGPVVLVGAGGIHAQAFEESVAALAPVSEPQAAAMLRSVGAANARAGARGRGAMDVRAAARAVIALSNVAAAHPGIAEIEVDPLLVTPTQALALDARLVLANAPPRQPIEVQSTQTTEEAAHV